MTQERMARLYEDRGVVRMRHLPTQLYEASCVRTVGFRDAVDDLGTHTMCGVQVKYTDNQVRKVLQGKNKSLRLLRRIAEKRPDLFGLRYVAPEVKEWYEKHGKQEVA